MVKKSKRSRANPTVSTLIAPENVDPALSALFISSLNQARPAPKKSVLESRLKSRAKLGNGSSSEGAPPQDSPGNAKVGEDELDSEIESPDLQNQQASLGRRQRKRKRNDDRLEDEYMQRLAEPDHLAQSFKSPRLDEAEMGEPTSVGRKPLQSDSPGDNTGATSASGFDVGLQGTTSTLQHESIPKHETLDASGERVEIERASRTVFLGNVSTAAIRSKVSRKALLDHLTSFSLEISKDKSPYKVESLRFRSTAYSTSSIPKKAAFAKKELMDATTRSTNAYAVYSSSLAAREALKKLNGTVILDRHLRVDGVAHPTKQDHRRCVFVGNLGFVDDESIIKAAEDGGDTKKAKKQKESADVEEGLWRQFENAGAVESVRVVRDKTTRVGKGFAYVQFKDPNSVERALLFNDKKYPPLLPRRLRVTRAKNITKTASHGSREKRVKGPIVRGNYLPKPNSKSQSLSGRAGKLFGHAGAAQLRANSNDEGHKRHPNGFGVAKSPEEIVFEGHRASENQGKGILGKNKTSKKNKRVSTKRTKRSVAFKAGRISKGR